MSRTDASGISGRVLATNKDDAKFGKIKTVGPNVIFHATGSHMGTSGFIIKTAGNTVISPTRGGEIDASDLNTKELYEIGVSRVSGSGTVHLVY
tara:strand:+ start:31 stop:312 length:282 start_codon:yes stop_codon:yes gene_type:complete